MRVCTPRTGEGVQNARGLRGKATAAFLDGYTTSVSALEYMEKMKPCPLAASEVKKKCQNTELS